MPDVVIVAMNHEAAEARAALYAPLRGVRTTVLSGGSDGSDGSALADLADLSLLPVAALHGAIRDAGGRCRAVLLPPDAALPPDGERIQKLLLRNKLHGFIRNTLFFHPAAARVLEVADAGCLGNIQTLTIERRVTARTVVEVPALEALFCRRYLPEADVCAALATESPATDKLKFILSPAQKETGEGWEIRVTGDGGTITASAPLAGGGSVKLVENNGAARTWEVPEEDPARLCLAAALLCLDRKEPLAFLDFKTAAKSLAFLAG